MVLPRTARPGWRRPTLRARMTLLYATLICTSGITLLGVTYLIAPGLLQHRSWAAAPGQPGAISAGHTSGIFSAFLFSDAFRAAAAAVAIMAAFSLALGWLISGRFVQPLRGIISSARDISASNLHQRLSLRGRGDEFAELGATLNDLFARLEASFDAQRHFIANASHELRTPLSAGRALLQVAIADPEPTVDTLRATCEELVELSDQQESLIAALLTLASSQRGLARPQPLDLADITRRVVEARRPEAERHGIRLSTALAPAPATGDPSLAESLIVNLIDNAIRHNIAGGDIQITTTTGHAGATLSVTSSGQVIPAAEVGRLFQPFQRLGPRPARRDGHGLGLSIVRAIATAHAATVTAQPRPGGGLAIDVTFPPPAPP